MKKREVKKAVYIVSWGMLGILFAIVIAGVVEIMSYRIANELDVEVILFGSMMIIGLIAGLCVGPIAWRKIYVEGLRGKKYLIKNN